MAIVVFTARQSKQFFKETHKIFDATRDVHVT